MPLVHSTTSDRPGAEAPFATLLAEIRPQEPLREAITAAYRRPEAECLTPLLDLATPSASEAARTTAVARDLVMGLRCRGSRGGVEALIHEYDLSSQEGVALMCLAEALLRVPDAATRDALIRDKIASGDWRAHVGRSRSPFVNAATWGLVVTGRLTATRSEAGLSAALSRVIARGGEPVIRKGVDLAMRMMGERFVTGQTIVEALRNARRMEARGFSYSYDMLGEAAATAEDAARYLADYEGAIHAIGRAAAGRGPYAGPGISIKLSALHPRYVRAKRGRVLSELLPRLAALARLAKAYDIGLNIDAEEADRLDLSLDLLEALALDPALSGWNGIGFVLQAYGRRCPFVVDWIVDLARRSERRLMIRLVKGAYWDSEIKRAQVDGLADFPVFTRKLHTDVSYLACARKLLGAPDAVFPQFATHNAQTVAAILAMAGPDFSLGRYEFQCLHGMGEPLYEQVVGTGRHDRPCRIYAPVGTHATLLAYLVRRLLENGANSSFVNRIADAAVPVEDLIADPVSAVRASSDPGAPHPDIVLPPDLYGPGRANAAGLDLSDERSLAALAAALDESAKLRWRAEPATGGGRTPFVPVLNPADHRDVVGETRAATPGEIDSALAAAAASDWGSVPAVRRAAALRRAADAMEARMPVLIGLAVREAGKSIANAVGEVREAVDFLRYYAAEAERTLDLEDMRPLGAVACISPWNFPLAIFTGQVAAALAAGNAVLAKPAEETPLIAAEAVRLLHAAGIPTHALQLVTGGGEAGAALVAAPGVAGVLFTGSTDVARLIQRELSARLGSDGRQIPLVAETGGQNAMVVDSSALAEQVVADVIASAFDSAGQRCSALRILCLQDDIAERTLRMLKGAMRELETGSPDRLCVDVGPVISARARDGILEHVAAMAGRGHAVETLTLPEAARYGTFVAPTLIEIAEVADVAHEVFGPVLHVLRYARADLDRVVAAIDATGYGLTFGLHTRIDETIAKVSGRIAAGNLYVNRSTIGAVVGVQPFGGSGLSGTGPKAGGPLYLGRLTRTPTRTGLAGTGEGLDIARAYATWLRSTDHAAEAEACLRDVARSPLGVRIALPGPVGERNVYLLKARGRIAALATTERGLLIQIGAILATGNTALVEQGNPCRPILDALPKAVAERVAVMASWSTAADLRGVLVDGEATVCLAVARVAADRPGPILAIVTPDTTDDGKYSLERLVEEQTISTNTTAAGGNATLMALA